VVSYRQRNHGVVERPDGAAPAPHSTGRQNPIRAMLARAGIRSGDRILDLGAQLYDREMSSQDLAEFRVLGLQEDASSAVPPQLRPVDKAASLKFIVRNISDVALPRASFDAVVAVDWWPSAPLADMVATWRHVLEPDGGVAVVAGTEVPTGKTLVSGPARQWQDELSAAGFRLEEATDVSAAPERYARLADDLRQVSEPLRHELGASVAKSYVGHVEQLDRVARRGLVRRYGIVARL
jgi:hypothetical protein